MNSFPFPFKIVATIFLTAALVIIGILNLRDRVSWTDPTDGILWNESDGGLQASEIELNSPGGQAGILPGDHLISINGQTLTNLGQYYDRLYQLGPNSSVTYFVSSGTEPRSVSFMLGSKVLFTTGGGLRTLLAFIHLGIGLFVIIRGNRLPRTFHFYLICLAAFVVFLYSWTPGLNALDWWVYGLSLAAFFLLPALFLHFCLRFPVDPVKGQSRASLLYAPAIFLSILQLFWLTGHLASIGLPRTTGSSEFLDLIHLVYFTIGFLTGALILLKRRLEARELIMCQQMKWISYGTLAGIVPFSLIYALPVLLGVRANFAMESSMLFLGLIPLSMGYAIIHYRLLDVEIIARQGAAYFIASSMLLAVYLFFVLVLGRGLQLIAPQANFMVICVAALAISLLFAPLRNAIQVRLDRLFYKDRFDDRASLMEFAQTLSTEISLVPLSRSILERVSKTFQIEKIALFLSEPSHNGYFRLVDALGLDLPVTRSHLYRENDLVDRGGSGSLFNPSETDFLHRAHSNIAKEGLHHLWELRLRGRLIGIIALGRLPQGKHFSTEDQNLLAALAGYAAIALENAGLYRSIETKALELERLKSYTENIIESINVAVLALDLNGRITSCNRAFEELYHARREQIIGAGVENLLSGDVLTSIQGVTGIKGWELRSPSNIFKLYLENQRGDRLIVNLSIIPLLNPMDVSSGCLIVLDDITAKVRLEDQLLQSEKLSSIGLLAAGIAHEVNTPIAGISSYTQMLLKETSESNEHREILEKIEKQTFRAAEIVNSLLNFSRLNGSEFKDLDVNQLIQDSLALLDHQLRQNRITVEFGYGQSLQPVYGNLGKLQQVFVNLFLNARDAMPTGGKLTIKTVMNESMVIVDISDTGVGISEEDMKRIYDPFFTTKTTSKGTGLGLAVTYGIIQEHGGRIFVDSTPGGGTHFRLKLPTRQALHQ